ncbi:MAG TPA: helix-turn-helix domain-containing protein, partial [Candidatus Binatia bacterium]
PLVEYILKKFNDRMKKNITGLDPRAMQKLIQYGWPGNVRELENTLECAAAITQKDTIDEDLVLTTKPSNSHRLPPLKEARDEFERDYLTQILRKAKGNVSQAARLAGKYRSDFYDLLRKHNVSVEAFKKLKRL